MTAVALALVQEVVRAGGTIRLDGDTLRLSAPEPLPDDLRVRLRQHKAEIVALLSVAEPAHDAAPVPVADQQADRDLPAEVADGVRAILAADGAQGCRRAAGRRSSVMRVSWSSADGCTRRSTSAGGAADLFGCDQRAPWHRLDRSGLVLLLAGHEIVELGSDVATLSTRTGSVLRYRRRPPLRPSVALLWNLLIPAQATGPPIRGTSEGADGGDVLGRTPPPS
jgi:TubC N-terminal docking domain